MLHNGSVDTRHFNYVSFIFSGVTISDVMSSGDVVASPVSGDASAAVILVTLR